MPAFVDEADDAGCRPTHFRVMMSEVIASCIYRLEMILPCKDKKLIRPRPDCVVCYSFNWSSRRYY